VARNLLLIVAIILVVLLPASAQIVTVGRPQLKGGVTLEVEHPYDTTYDAVRSWLLRKDYAISVSDREAGQLVTMMAVTTASAPTGETSQTGIRLILTFKSNAANLTTIKVVVTEQHRGKYAAGERHFTNWSPARVNDAESQRVAQEIRVATQ
jgi:hypothetical protein